MPERTVQYHLVNMNDKQRVNLTNSKVQDLAFRKVTNKGEFFLTESGLYQFIFRSNAPKADKFTNWVTDEVLP